MPGPEQIGADVFPTAEEVAGGFFLRGRDVNRRQRAGPIQRRQVRGIPTVGVDPIAGATRDERWRDHIAEESPRAQRVRWSSKPHGPAS